MRLSRYVKKAAMGAAAIPLLAGCAGEQGTGGAVERAAERPASWTDLPVRTGARDVVHTDADHRSYKVRITVKSLVRGSEEDMRGARADEELKGMVPHYLSFEVTNTGRKRIPAAYMVDSNFALNGTDWARGEKVYVSGGRPGGVDLPCADTAPKTLAPGDSYNTCVTYALPKGVGVLSLTHNADGYLDEGGAVATWRVEGGLEAASAGLAEPGEVVRVRWDAREDGVLELPATLVSVRRGSATDLAGLDLGLNGNERRGIPYYVSVTYTNPGPKDLYADQANRVRLLTEGGRQIQGKTPFVVDTKIPGCPSDWVARTIPPGDSVTECSIHLVTDDGDKPFAVGFAEAGRPGLVAWRAPLR
ncbi:hypothetical protein OG963_23610 [Streptomyces sp. NBC_01707]|jgi:hypothetical protein|uniref:hypothetical protein n=1 Tax=unclassified Streptomyces TaxID=2593676 RepID=UPI000888CB13|nr:MULTISPECIES: hypothetical protein [unclassified Streptomyces]MDX3766670.1 hypothetical protein [Streptomyces sp. AK08-01B]MDX3816786.1 hypothetical protein [Streptomyces sp. AK08-01A]SCY75785.1 hypothetical protein SAMN02745898_103373 [Streptomyces sp. 136MFCol5.1]SFT29439.1 hypothetical protein SAMN04487982_114172 [Streptomyces sp. ok210]